jgi:uncharacterized repeat protein (TIGR03803 family)
MIFSTEETAWYNLKQYGTEGCMKRYTRQSRAWGIFVLWGATAVSSPGSSFSNLVTFSGSNGYNPVASLVQGTDGNFYGTTEYGGTSVNCNLNPFGPSGCGTIFKVTSSGVLTTLHSFDYTDGAYPQAALVLAIDGNFYGTTSRGGITTAPQCNTGNGVQGCGTIFKITPGGALTTVHQFDGTDGAGPSAAVTQAASGSFYGTTANGGTSNNCTIYAFPGCGTVFKITPEGVLTSLHSFDAVDGAVVAAGLIRAGNGNYYGTTQNGGVYGLYGTVFQITPAGSLTTLHNFDLTDGDYANGLVQGTSGLLLGTAAEGGGHGWGTIFRITPEGAFATVHNFNVTDGETPRGGLVLATDGNFYGTTAGGGASQACLTLPCYGTVFALTPAGALRTLYSFDFTNGAYPEAGLLQATDGSFYGTTQGNSFYGGSVFRVAVRLGPFVKTLPTSGKAGATVRILGTNLAGATSVTFNGTPATFTVGRTTEITTTVPLSATTGKVQVTTPGGTLSSNVTFRITP